MHDIWSPLRGKSPSKSLWKIHKPYIENDLKQTLSSCLKFHISEHMTYFFIFSSLIFCLFNIKIFSIRSFRCISAHYNVIRKVGNSNCLIIARTSNWNFSQDVGVSLMVFMNTNPFSEVTKVSKFFLNFLLNIVAVLFQEIFSFGSIVLEQTEQKKIIHTRWKYLLVIK